ncbi:hypothetical protein FGG08_001450 [Glutinoglossum americanum]|uniref:Ras modification protein ERF4 n=1 Tax=Glutinoglossum americanum TaxID=1670608 RepID=A0A9P8L089_9PEZI|nr:hypothetical protein FGG08_001450 [Glutinoglossum americanum]
MSCGGSRSRPSREGKEEVEEGRERGGFASPQAAAAKTAHLVTVHLEDQLQLHPLSTLVLRSPRITDPFSIPPPQQPSPQRLLSPPAIKPLHHRPRLKRQTPATIQRAFLKDTALPWNSIRRQQSAARLWNPVNYLPRDFSQPKQQQQQQQQQRSRADSTTGWQHRDIVGDVVTVHSSPPRTLRDVKGKRPVWQLTPEERAVIEHERGTQPGKRDTFGLEIIAMGENADGDGVDAVAHKENSENVDLEAKEQERRRQSADHARRVQQSLRQADTEIQPPIPRVATPTINTDLERGDVGVPPSSRVGIPRDSPRLQSSFQHFPSVQPTGASSQQPQGPTNDNGVSQEELDDYGWGPSHPCFPHINTHVPLNSPEATSTRIIRIRRDWLPAGDLAPTFSNLYPEILDPYLPEEEFRLLIQRLNDELTRAFDPWSLWNWVDAVMGVLTLWVWDDVGATVAKRRLRALEEWVREWNEKEGKMEGVKVVELRRTGYMSLDIQIPDPHIGTDEPDFPNSRPVTAMRDTHPAIPALTVNGEQEEQPQPGDLAASTGR